jgi:hypothetical protein
MRYERRGCVPMKSVPLTYDEIEAIILVLQDEMRRYNTDRQPMIDKLRRYLQR